MHNSKCQFFAGLVAVATLCSCGSIISVSEGNVEVISKINTLAREDRAKLYLRDSLGFPDDRAHLADQLFVSLDSARWVDPDGNANSAPFVRVDRIVFVDHGDGAVEGLGTGALVGGAMGLALGVATAEDSWLFSKEGIIAFSTLLMAGAGGFWGLVAGAIVGEHTSFEFRSPDQ